MALPHAFGMAQVRREQLGLEALTERCLHAARLEALLLDDGYLAGRTQPIAWHARFVPCRRILRLEALAEELLTAEQRFSTFLERFRAALDPPPAEVVALKSIAAYRGGLEAGEPAPAEAESAFLAWRSCHDGQPARLTDRTLIDFLLRQALELAARHALPVQFHTGFGDPDLDLRQANPLHLRWLLEDTRYRQVPIVLLHLYPFVREGGYLASVYPQVHVDFGLAVPLLSVAGMRATVQQLLELAPASKVLYSSDAHLVPDLFYLGAKWGRQVLGEVLEQAMADGDLSAAQADGVARAILLENARQLYRIRASDATTLS